MTLSIGLVLLIVVLAVVAFAIEIVSADVVGLGVLLALVATGILTPAQGMSGFGSDAVLMIFGLLVMTAALARTGVVDVVGRMLVRRGQDKPGRLAVWIMVATGTLSSFISNTAATAFFLPVAMGIARRTHASPSRFLLPLAFASILASSVSLVSTSTNIVVNDLMKDAGMAEMGLFELAPVGVPILVIGLLYMALVGRRLIPVREGDESTLLGARAYLAELVVHADSPFAGKTLAESRIGSDLGLTVLRIVRKGSGHLVPIASTRLEGDDVLLVEGARDDVLRVREVGGIDIRADVKIGDASVQDEDVGLVEAVLLPTSVLLGRTLRGVRFRERFGLQVLALEREGRVLQKLADVRLRLGDLLLVQGPRTDLRAVEAARAFRVLGAVETKRPVVRRAGIAVSIFVLVLAVAGLRIVALPIAALLGAFLVFATRCITPEEAYREVDWKVVILIGSMLSLGTAMQVSGAADWLAGRVVDVVGTSGTSLLSGFFALAVLLTQLMSNQAAAIVVLPVALQVAAKVGHDPRPFAVIVAVAASCSYLTPLEPSCLMVYGPGRYRFADFLRVGAPLTLLIYGIAITLVPRLWPL